MRTFAIALLALAMAVSGAAAEESPASSPAAAERPFDARALWEMERISSPAVSPDGARVVFVVRATDFDANRGRTDLWIAGTDGAGLKRLTWDPASDHSPAWTPDGSAVLFLSTRSGSSQVWRLPVDGGEAAQVTDLPVDVGGFKASPDGSRLAVAVEVFPDCDTVKCTADRLAAIAERKDTARAYDRLFVRHWDAWKDGRRSHLVVVRADGAGEPIDLQRGMDADAPTKPFGGMEEVAWTPDGSGVVFTARDVGASEAWSTDFDLYLAPADGSAPPRCLTEANPAWDTAPSFSPDGATLAWVAMARPGFEADRLRVMLAAWPDGEPRELTADWDRSVGGVTWSPDGSTLYAAVEDVGEVKLFAIDVATGTPRLLVAGGHVRDPQPAGDRLLFGRDDLRSPVALFTAARDGSDVRKIVDVNAERLAAIATGEPEPFSFPGWNDETVHAWLVKPVGFDPAKRYPIAFLIHGGPQGSFGNDFHYRWNPQAYAGRGYAAVMIDFHGSTGYGQEFTDSISGDWGGKPLVDLQKGLAAALERYPWMDGDRACALGASYGGYMINWIAGRWPDGFRCLVNHDGVFDTRAMYFETEELWFPEWENRGTPWDSAASYEVYNPAKYVDRWRAPMLVVHGGLDFRVPETQGIAAFTAAQRRGVPSRMLYFPDENHWVLSPANGLRWHDEVLGWLDRWTGAGAVVSGGGAAPRPVRARP